MLYNLWPPYLLFYTDNVKEGSAGQANGPVIRIRPAYKDDKGLLFHEIEHVRHWWYSLGFSKGG